MYLWNIDKLVDDLKNNKLPKKNILLYKILSPILGIFNAFFFGTVLVIHQMIAQIFTYFLSSQDPHFVFYNNLAWFMGTAATCFTFIGFYLCYKTNKNGDGKNFFTRMACLSFPIYFHLTVYILAILMVLFFLSFSFFQLKVVYFKYQIFSQTKACIPLKESIQHALKDTSVHNIVCSTAKKSSFLKTIFSTPGTILKIPLIPGKISAFTKDLRSSLFTIYPLLTLLPPTLALTHYLVVRRMLRRVCEIKK